MERSEYSSTECEAAPSLEGREMACAVCTRVGGSETYAPAGGAVYIYDDAKHAASTAGRGTPVRGTAGRGTPVRAA